MFVWDLGQVCSSCQVFAPGGVLLHIKKFLFPQIVASDANEQCIPCVSAHGCFCYHSGRCLSRKCHGLPQLAVCCFNARDLPGLCSTSCN